MTADTTVRARIDAKTKKQAAKALAAMGLSVSDYIRMALVRVARDKAVPFPVHVPNEQTAATLRKSERGEDVHSAEDAEALFRDLGL
ncbi:MAG: type II toxin-antitoxin system RelB/DinJ family antitoxin [Gammaproteobacteria bacterium]